MERWFKSACSLLSTAVIIGLAAAPALGSDDQRGSASVSVCGPPTAGTAACHARLLLDRTGTHPFISKGGPAGYTPADLQSAYNLPSATAGDGQTVAVVDAYDGPTAESDLAVYRSTFGFPPCTTANGCFTKIDQNGGTNYPKADHTWAFEMDIDLEMISAVCPKCHILLVEATTNSDVNLTTAVNEAATFHPTAISNSYGATEYAGQLNLDAAYNHPGIAITVSTGDSGFGVQWPSTSPYVTAVGGTSLVRATNRRGWTETAWPGAGSGCSAYEPQPSWQAANPTIAAACTTRAAADVSAVADINDPVSVYDSFGYRGLKDWFLAGGTSVGSPIIASVYALAGNASSLVYGSYPYAHPKLFDVTAGSNGSCGTVLCNAAPGWDGPTGLGTPDGTGAF